jgi:uncharacterized protein YndB with AHSA1/START domain
MATSTDRIDKKILLHAPRERVWRALSDSKQFGTWFGARFDQPFIAGTAITGKFVPTAVDAEVAKSQQKFEGTPFSISIDRIEPISLFSFRWHPYAVDPGVDYSKEPTTLVVFELEEVSGGTMLKVTESGFDNVPLERRAKAFASHSGGWSDQLNMIGKYLALAA